MCRKFITLRIPCWWSFGAAWEVGGEPLDPPGVGDQSFRPLGAQEDPPLKFDPPGVGDQTSRPLGAD